MPDSMQQTEQIRNDLPRMGAESITTSNHPSTRLLIMRGRVSLYVACKIIMNYLRHQQLGVDCCVYALSISLILYILHSQVR